MKDYYEILKIRSDAKLSEIKRSFRELAKEYHPDANTGLNETEAERKFNELVEAYKVLSDEAGRIVYDVARKQKTVVSDGRPLWEKCKRAFVVEEEGEEQFEFAPRFILFLRISGAFLLALALAGCLLGMSMGADAKTSQDIEQAISTVKLFSTFAVFLLANFLFPLVPLADGLGLNRKEIFLLVLAVTMLFSQMVFPTTFFEGVFKNNAAELGKTRGSPVNKTPSQ